MKNKLKKTMTALCAALIFMGGFSVPAYAQGAATEPPAEDATNDSNVVVEETEETPPLTPKGNATLVDDFGGNKQLITVTTKGGNYFYIYEDGTEGLVTDLEDLQTHAEKGGLFGMEKETWEALREYNSMKQELRESEPSKEALLLYGKEDAFGIYQIRDGKETRDLRFEPYDRLRAAGNTVHRGNYTLVYTAPLTPGTSLEDIYTRFNIDHPKDFKGHSLSVSDVVVLHQNGQDTAHYVDSFGYKDVSEFLQPENYLKAAEQTTEQNYNMIDGQINNTPTAAELEEKAKAGEQISLAEYAKALKTDKERGKSAKQEKPSIRAQLKAAKEQTTKKQARQKTQDLERS